MKVVSLVCEKGGVGKTMLADELCYHFERLGIPVSLYMLDGQYVSRDRVIPGAEVSVIDTAGTLDAMIRDVVKRSDVVAVPVRPSLNDIEPFTRTIDVLDKITDVPVLIVVNAWTPYTMSKRFMEWLDSKGRFGKRVFVVPQSEYLTQCIGSGHSVVGHDRSGRATKAVLDICDAVSEIFGMPTERTDETI